MITQDMVDCWRANYGLERRSPEDAARWWHEQCNGMAPAGAVAALGLALLEMESLRKDVERYSYLRNRAPREVLEREGEAAGCWIDCEIGKTLTLLTGVDADAAIDFAMQGK